MIMTMKKLFAISILIAASFCTSCIDGYVYDDARYETEVVLGATEKVLFAESTDGQCSLNVITNCDYEARIISGEKWASFSDSDQLATPRAAYEKVLSFNYDANTAGPRVAKVVLSAEGRRDTIAIKQYGLYEESVTVVGDTTIAAPVNGGHFTRRIEFMGLLEKDIKISCAQTDIVSNIILDDNKVLSFDVLKNETQNPRTAKVEIAYVNGWGEKKSAVVTVNQTWH